MQLVTFGIDREINLVIQFLVFIQPYIQKPVILYQIETVPVTILDTNTEAQYYTHLHVNKPYIALTPSVSHVTVVAVSHLVEKVPSQELLSATELSVRLVQ